MHVVAAVVVAVLVIDVAAIGFVFVLITVDYCCPSGLSSSAMDTYIIDMQLPEVLLISST